MQCIRVRVRVHPNEDRPKKLPVACCCYDEDSSMREQEALISYLLYAKMSDDASAVVVRRLEDCTCLLLMLCLLLSRVLCREIFAANLFLDLLDLSHRRLTEGRTTRAKCYEVMAHRDRFQALLAS